MRWILPLLSLALAYPAFGELAVYTGIVNVQDAQAGPLQGRVRMAEVIDLDTGKIVTVALTAPGANYTYVVGPEVQYIIAKAKDARGHAITAFAQAATATVANGATHAVSSNLRGRDASVTLSTAGASHWPRTLVGTASVVATAGTDPVANPGNVAFTVTSLVLSESWSKVANHSGTLTQAANVIGPLLRDRVSSFFHYPAPGTSQTGSSQTTITGGVVTTGAGTLQIGTGSIFTGGTVVVGGTLNPGNSLPVTGGTLILTSATGTGTNTVLTGGTLVVGGTLTPGTSLPVTGSTLILNPATGTGASTITLGGTLTTNAGSIQAGTLGLTKTGAGAVLLAGNGALNYTGSTLNVGAASLQLNNATGTITGLTGPFTVIRNGSILTGANLGSLTVNAPITSGTATPAP